MLVLFGVASSCFCFVFVDYVRVQLHGLLLFHLLKDKMYALIHELSALCYSVVIDQIGRKKRFAVTMKFR